jgi:glycine/D-amino acid oxidase-like deaminating enzyme
MLSFWEQQSFLKYDYIIVGSGIVGLSAALSIRERNETASILILERGILPTGASTKNAGFACIGSLTEIIEDLKTLTEKEVVELVALRLKGLQLLRKRLGDAAIDYKEEGSYELISENEAHYLSELERINQLLFPVLNKNAYTLSDEKIADFNFDKKQVKHLVQNNLEGQLDTGKMMKALIALALSRNIEIKTGSTVSSFIEKENEVNVMVANVFKNHSIQFICKKLIICTNAFSSKLLSNLDLQPGRGQVLITKPIPNLKVKGIFHFDKGYYYFRNFEDRVLFGGGRNLDFQKESSTEFEYNETILEDLKDKLRHLILPETPFEIDQSWVGIMAFGTTKFPIIKKHSDLVIIGVRMGGMGVAIGSQAGELLADLVLND